MEKSDYLRTAKRKVDEEKQLARCSIEPIDGPDLQLLLNGILPDSIFTEDKVAAEQGAPIHVELINATTGSIVTSGPESSAKLEVVALQGDFDKEDEMWTQIEFERHVVGEREGKRPLLIGDSQVSLKKGVGALQSLSFTDNSSWVRSKKFRLGVKVAAGHCKGIRIREAKTKAFVVKDQRGKSYQKHNPPALDDEVWRLEKIRKGGKFCKSLNDNGIRTVRHFLRHLTIDPQKLSEILGISMQNKTWEALVGHAKTTCALDEKLHVYHLNDSKTPGIIFNDVYKLKGLVKGGNYYPADFLSCNEKVSLVKKAYDDWEHIIEYDGNAILNFNQNTLESEMTLDEIFNLVDSTPSLPIPIKRERPTAEAGLPLAGTSCNENPIAGYLMHTRPNCFQFGGTSSPLQNQPTGISHQTQIFRNDSMGEMSQGFPHLSMSEINAFLSSPVNNSASNYAGSSEVGVNHGFPLNLDHNVASIDDPDWPVCSDKKVIVKLDLRNDKNEKHRVMMKLVCDLSGIDSISMDMKDKQLTVVGDVDPDDIVSKLKENWHAEIVSIGPAKEPEKKYPNEQVAKPLDLHRAYTPYATTHYNVQNVEEHPNACVICNILDGLTLGVAKIRL